MAVPIAFKNLFEGRTRFVISVGGVALSILLILVLDGVFAGSKKQTTVYIDKTPYDLVVSQRGVKNLHMTTSFYPASKISEVKRVKGVKSVAFILYTTDYLVSENNRSVAYVIGYEPGRLGGPWTMAEGDAAKLKKGQIIIDERIAGKHGLKVGDRISVLGRSFKIGGLTKETVTIVNSIAFLRFDDFERIRGLRGVVSYAFVNVEPEEEPERVLDRIEEEVKGVTVQTKEAFAESERRVISDMSVDIMRIMNFMGFLIGLAALGLTVYTATLSKIREYGILKALGSKNRKLFGVVVEQAVVSITIGFLASVVIFYIMVAGLSLARSNILLVMELPSVLKVILASSIIGILASAIPILRIARVKPAEVFRH